MVAIDAFDRVGIARTNTKRSRLNILQLIH